MDVQILEREVVFRAVRSSGPGGQHVNKTSSKVVLLLSLHDSKALNDHEKELIFSKIPSRINAKGVLRLVSQDSRNQHANRQFVWQKLLNMFQRCFAEQKERIPLTVTEEHKAQRLKEKKARSEKKEYRKKIIP